MTWYTYVLRHQADEGGRGAGELRISGVTLVRLKVEMLDCGVEWQQRIGETIERDRQEENKPAISGNFLKPGISIDPDRS